MDKTRLGSMFKNIRKKYCCGMLRNIIPVFILCLLFFAWSGFSDTDTDSDIQPGFLTAEEIKWLSENDGKIRVAPDPYFPPLEYFNEKGNLEGIAADYVRLIEKKTGIRFQIVRLESFEKILEKAKKSEIDIVCTVINTPERAAYLRFTSPYISIPNAIVTRNDNSRKLDVKDLGNMTDIVYQGGYAIGSLLTGKYGITQAKPVTSPEEALKDLSMGRINVMVGNLATISYYSRKNNFTNLKVAGDCNFDDTLSFASRRDLPVLHSILEKTLAEITSKERDAILDKWIKIETIKFYDDINFWIAASGILGFLSAVIAILYVWNMTLKRLIGIKTLELKKSGEKYRSLVENSNESIFVFQNEFPVFANPAALKLAGCSEHDFFSVPFIEFIHKEDRPMVMERYRQRLDGDLAFYRYPCRFARKDGETRWIEISSVLIDWEESPAILNFITDVTERKEAEDEKTKLQQYLSQIQKIDSIGRLAGGVAHDFNNMLTAILGHAELAMMKTDPSQPLYLDLKEINNAAERSAALTRQLLSFARKQTALPRVISLNETVEGMLKMLARLIGENIELVWKPVSTLCNVKIDPGQVEQILTNLVVNARDAVGGKSGRIVIETGDVVFDESYCSLYPEFIPGEYVMLSVSDNGCGMSMETRAGIFEPFFTTKKSGEGTGLGLATVYGIVKQNSGFINVYSEPEEGSIFRIYFGKYLGDETKSLPENSRDNVKGGSETIMLVEDETVIRELARTILEHFGYKVLSASTPGDAIRIAENHKGKISLLVTDIVMPEMNGRNLSERISLICPNMKKLFMSGYTADVIAHNGILNEGLSFIQKPFTAKDFAVKVRDVIDDAN